jgi:K+ transporter
MEKRHVLVKPSDVSRNVTAQSKPRRQLEVARYSVRKLSKLTFYRLAIRVGYIRERALARTTFVCEILGLYSE